MDSIAKKQLKNYRFTVILNGIGSTPDEAWLDAQEGFVLDPGPTPEPHEYEAEDIDGQEA